MEQESSFYKTDSGDLHFRHPQVIDETKPTILFLHGGSPRSQNTKFWSPILGVLEKHCNPILLDRFGHGMSKLKATKIGLKDHIASIQSFIDNEIPNHIGLSFGMIGRSAGAGFALRLLHQSGLEISGIGLIAPGSLKTNAKHLQGISVPCFVYWDIQDPVVKFSNYQLILDAGINHQLYTVGHPDDLSPTVSISHDNLKNSHAPELIAPDFFDKFLADFCSHLK